MDMSKFESIKPALNLLLKDSQDAHCMISLFYRFLDEGIAEEFIHYLDDSKLMNFNVWHSITYTYYDKNNSFKSPKMNQFLYDYSLGFWEKFVKIHDNDVVEKYLDIFFPKLTYMRTDITEAWLEGREAHFILHLFSHLSFSHYPALRKGLSKMATVNENNNIVFNDDALALLEKIATKEGLDKFIYKIDLETLLNSNFTPWILDKIIEQDYTKELLVQASLGKTEVGLQRFLENYSFPPVGGGPSMAYYLMSNTFISIDLFKLAFEPILKDEHAKKIMLDYVTHENLLTNALGYNLDKVIYLIESFDLDARRYAVPKYDDIITADIFYLDELTKLKEYYKDSKMFNFSFMMNAILEDKSFLHQEDVELRLEKLLMLSNAKQLDKKTMFSNAVKYLTHQKTQFDQQHLESLKSVIEKIYFSIEEEMQQVDINIVSAKRKMKI